MNVLGCTHYWYYTSNNQRIEADIEINWNIIWGVNGEDDKFDLQSTMAHELGHVLCLEDLYEPDEDCETMHGFGPAGDFKQRTLYCGDKNGVVATYGERALAIGLAPK